MRKLAIAVVLGALALPGAAPSAPNVTYIDPAWSPDGQTIAFASTRDDPLGYLQIYVMNADGSNVRRLTSGPEAKTAPSWSPSGRQIAFQASASVDVMDADGSNRHRIVAGGSCCGPRWSPKGRRIAYNWYDEFVAKVYAVKPDGTGAEVVAAPGRKDDCYSYGGPTWSPDGQRIAFSAGSAGDCKTVEPFLGIVSRYRGRITKLVRRHGIYSADWSPNGRTILLVETPGVQSRALPTIALLNLRTRKLRSLGHKATYTARWSPNGRQIVFTWQNRIYVMNARGSGTHLVIPH